MNGLFHEALGDVDEKVVQPYTQNPEHVVPEQFLRKQTARWNVREDNFVRETLIEFQ